MRSTPPESPRACRSPDVLGVDRLRRAYTACTRGIAFAAVARRNGRGRNDGLGARKRDVQAGSIRRRHRSGQARSSSCCRSAAAFDPSEESARRGLLAKSEGGVYGACDFAGSTASLAFATGALARGGRVVITGLLGGDVQHAKRAVRAQSHCHRGNADRNPHAGARTAPSNPRAQLAFPPIKERPMAEAQAALDALRAGKVLGRVVLAT